MGIEEEEFGISAVTEPAGGWHSVKGLSTLLKEHVALRGTRLLIHQNKPEGFACVSCSWAKPAKPHLFEFCVNGAKATAWETTAKRTTSEFFKAHSVTKLRDWSDMALESQGRLTAPLRYDRNTDRYLEVSWERAFQEIGAETDAARARVGGFLRVWACLARDLLHVSAVGPHVRQQQSPRQLEHVS